MDDRLGCNSPSSTTPLQPLRTPHRKRKQPHGRPIMKSILSPRRIVTYVAALATLISLLAPTVSAGEISGTINGQGENPHPRDLSSRTRVTLNGGKYTAMITKDGKFIFADVPQGSYLLEVQSPQYVYPTVRVVVTEKDPRAYLVAYGADWSNDNNIVQLPLALTPRAATEYFIAREGFKLQHLFANPMMLMMGFSVVMLFIMPKLMANMDPEAMEEIQGMQESTQMPAFEMPDIAATLAKFSTGNSAAAGSAKKKQ